MNPLKPLAFALSLPLPLFGTPTFALAAAPVHPAPQIQPAQPVQPVPYAPSQPIPYAAGPTPPPLPPPSPVTVSAAAAGTAFATGNDVVVLKDGGMLRGTLLEVLPNDHATVQLATGQSARVQWDHIERIERGAAALPAAPTVLHAPAPSSDHAARVRIESERPVTLERHEGGKAWSTACASPCDADLSLDDEYRIVGAGVRRSSPFRLAASPGSHVTLDVNIATKGAFAGGVVLTSLGPVAMVVGLIIVAVGHSQDAVLPSFGANGGSTSTSSDSSSTVTAGWVTVAVGALTTVGGIVILAGNAHSRVGQTHEQVERGTAGDDAWRRLPTWRADPNAVAAPRAAMVPLLSRAF